MSWGFMINKVVEEDFLQPLAKRTLPHQISIYADDVVIFVRASAGDIDIILDILHLFGSASGL